METKVLKMNLEQTSFDNNHLVSFLRAGATHYIYLCDPQSDMNRI